MSNSTRQHLQLVRQVQRQHLRYFIYGAFEALNPGHLFHHGRYIDCIARALEKAHQGEIKRLIISLPPRHLKSTCASIAFTAWLLGHDPACKIISLSYGNELSIALSRDTRRLMQSRYYRALFPHTVLERHPLSDGQFQTTAGGLRYATTMSGALTGLGADYVIVDDPIKAQESGSQTVRDHVKATFETALTRLNNQNEGVVILVMQRVHEDDLVSHLVQQGAWTYLSMPLVAEEDTEYETGDGDVYLRRRGELLNPALLDHDAADRLRTDLGRFAFEAQYQQNPIPVGGTMLNREWFRFTKEPPDAFDFTIQSWDLAGGTGPEHDWSVCTSWGLRDREIHLTDVFRRKLSFPDLLTTAHQPYERDRPRLILMETTGIGYYLFQQLRCDGLPMYGMQPRGSKIDRLDAVSGAIQMGRVILPDQAPWQGTFLKELLAFPQGRHDDQVDSLSQFLYWLNHRENSQRPRQRPNFERHQGQRLNLPSFPREDPLDRFRARRRFCY